MNERLPEHPIKQELGVSSLNQLQEHFIHLYGRRNDVYLPGRTVRIELFHRGVADLNDAIRKEAAKEIIEDMFARIVSRIFCIAHGINNVPVAHGLCRKYPFEGCSYCHTLPCQCGERRPDADLDWGADISQMQWSLGNWQNHLNKLYGEKNRERGLNYILNRLSSEVGELITLEHDVPEKSMDRIEQEYQLELADSLAWTLAAANFLDVDVQNAVIGRYSRGCQRCGLIPCNCGPHSFKQVRDF